MTETTMMTNTTFTLLSRCWSFSFCRYANS